MGSDIRGELLPSRCPEDETIFIDGRARAEAVESSTGPRVDLPFLTGRAAAAADALTSRGPGEDIVAIARSAARAADQGLTLVPISAQLELTLPLSTQLTLSPTPPRLSRGCGPKVLKLSSNGSDVFLKVLKLSSEVSECKPLPLRSWRRVVPAMTVFL
jgi:hypothetical protein